MTAKLRNAILVAWSCSLQERLLSESVAQVVDGNCFLVNGQLGEEMLPFNIYICPKCERIELFADEEAKRRLLH